MLITLDDLQSALNVDLSDPNGQTVATNLIATATSELSSLLGFPLEETSVTTYFDGDAPRLWLPTGAPVTDLALATYNPSTNAYDTLDSQYVRSLGDARVSISQFIPGGADAIRATYTTGWTPETLPADLKQALIELVGIKLLAIANYSSSTTTTDANGNVTTNIPTGALKRVQADAYSAEYSTAESDAYWKGKAAQLSHAVGDSTPAGILETVNRYKRPFAL